MLFVRICPLHCVSGEWVPEYLAAGQKRAAQTAAPSKGHVFLPQTQDGCLQAAERLAVQQSEAAQAAARITARLQAAEAARQARLAAAVLAAGPGQPGDKTYLQRRCVHAKRILGGCDWPKVGLSARQSCTCLEGALPLMRCAIAQTQCWVVCCLWLHLQPRRVRA